MRNLKLSFITTFFLCISLMITGSAYGNYLASTDTVRESPFIHVDSFELKERKFSAEYDLMLRLKNSGGREVTTIRVNVGDSDNIYPLTPAAIYNIKELGPGQYYRITVPVNISLKDNVTQYSLPITYTYLDQGMEATQSETVLIRVSDLGLDQRDFTNARDILSFKELYFSPNQPDLAEPFVFNFYYENNSQVAVTDLEVELSGMDNFEVLELTNKKTIGNINGGVTGNVARFKLKAEEERASNQVQIKATFNYLGQKREQVDVLKLPLPDPNTLQQKPLLNISSFAVAKDGSGKYQLKLKVENKGSREARQVRLTMEDNSDSGIFPVNRSNVLPIHTLQAGETKEVAVPIAVIDKENLEYYPVTAVLDYYDSQSKEYNVKEVLRINRTDLGFSSLINRSGVPRVIINKYSLSEDQVLAGNRFSLTMFLENTNIQEVHNTKVSLGIIQMEEKTGGTVFSPINGSNSFHIDKIGGRSTVAHTIDLYVDPSATAKTYVVPIKIVYEDRNGEVLTEEDIVNIPVTQESRLQIISVDKPPIAFIGEPVPISAEFVNVGKVDLDNFMVSLEGDFHKENATYFVGKLQIGASEYFQALAFPEEEGTLSGKVKFTYIDNNNQPVEWEEAFELEVQERPMQEFDPHEFDHMEEQHGAGLSKAQMAGLAGAVIIGAGGFFFWRKRQQKKKDELFEESL